MKTDCICSDDVFSQQVKLNVRRSCTSGDFYPAPYLHWRMNTASAESEVNRIPPPTAEILLQTNKRDGAPLRNPLVGWRPLLK